MFAYMINLIQFHNKFNNLARIIRDHAGDKIVYQLGY